VEYSNCEYVGRVACIIGDTLGATEVDKQRQREIARKFTSPVPYQFAPSPSPTVMNFRNNDWVVHSAETERAVQCLLNGEILPIASRARGMSVTGHSKPYRGSCELLKIHIYLI